MRNQRVGYIQPGKKREIYRCILEITSDDSGKSKEDRADEASRNFRRVGSPKQQGMNHTVAGCAVQARPDDQELNRKQGKQREKNAQERRSTR